MKKTIGIIFILLTFQIHAQQKRSWAIEAGPNFSWATKTYESSPDIVQLKPWIGFSAGVIMQHQLNNNFYLETGLKYKITQYKYTILNSVGGKGLSGRMLVPALLGYYKKDISEKLSLTASAGAIADLIPVSGKIIYLAAFQDTTLNAISTFDFNKKANLYLVGSLGILKRKSEERKFEIQLSYYHSLIYEREGIITIYKNGVPIDEAKHKYYGSNLSLQFRYYFRNKIPTKPE